MIHDTHHEGKGLALTAGKRTHRLLEFIFQAQFQFQLQTQTQTPAPEACDEPTDLHLRRQRQPGPD